jgi:hypothetical protein
MLDFIINQDEKSQITISGSEDITKDVNGLLIASGLRCSVKTMCEKLVIQPAKTNLKQVNPAFHPYQNESEQLVIDGLTIENREDRISIYGELVITDYATAAKLLNIFTAIYNALNNMNDLPDIIRVEKPEIVKNPFQA